VGLFRSSKPKVTRQDMLDVIPVRNPRARVEELDDGGMILRIPVRAQRIVRWLVREDPRRPRLRSFELDPLGAQVWELCDGRRSVRRLIRDFATRNKLNLREADVSILAYLKTLTSRGLLFFPDPRSQGRR
jgi:hypothetical protein